MSPIDPPPQPVETVVVRAAQLPPPAGAKAFSIVTLDAAQIGREPELDAALKQVPGVSLFRRSSSLSANPTVQGLSLRAIAPSGSSRALVTLDGVPLNDPFGGWVVWSQLPPEAVEAVSVVRGAGAGPYGAGALTGVVAIEERADAPGTWTADGSAGSLETALGAGVDTLGVGSGQLFVTVSGESTRGWNPIRAGRGPADTDLSLHGRQGSLRYSAPLGSGELALRFSGYGEDRGTGVRGGTAHAEGSLLSLAWAAQPAPDAPGWRLQAWARESGFSQMSLSEPPGHLTATPANSQFATPASGFGLNAAVRRATLVWSWELGVDARTAEGQTHELFRFISGAFTRTRVAGGRNGVAGLYAEASRTEGKWLFTGGVRLDGWAVWDGERVERDRTTGATTLALRPQDRSGSTPTARTGVRRDFDGGTYLRAAAYAGFRPPTLNELYRPFRVGNDVTEANPALQPERLFGAEIGVGHVGKSWSWSATLFDNRLEDAVTNVTVGVGPATFPVAGFIPAGGTLRMRENAGAIDAVGLEAEARRSFIADRLVMHAALSATDARVDGGSQAPQLTGKRPAEAPVWTATGGIDWRATDRLSFWIDGRFESRRFEDDLNQRPLKAAISFDARATWRLSRSADLYLQAQNLFDAAVPTGAAADATISYGAPRIVSVGVAVRR